MTNESKDELLVTAVLVQVTSAGLGFVWCQTDSYINRVRRSHELSDLDLRGVTFECCAVSGVNSVFSERIKTAMLLFLYNWKPIIILNSALQWELHTRA